MRKSIILLSIIIIFILSSSLSAQNENATWLIGNRKGIDSTAVTLKISFSDTGIIEQSLIPYTGNWIIGNEATYSDPETGELLLFSEGTTIYNGNFEIIVNGDEIYLTQRVIESLPENTGMLLPSGTYFIHDPGNHNRIYYFNSPWLGFYPMRVKSYYYIIEKNSSGRFKVINPEAPTFFTLDETHFMPMFIRHANGRDWWIVVLSSNGIVEFYILDPQGVHLSHTQKVNVPTEGSYIGYGLGNFQLNSNILSYFVFDAASDEETYPENLIIMKFNRCTGLFYDIINQPIHIDSLMVREDINKSVEFYATATSPDGRYLYIASLYVIYQFDLTAKNWYKTRKNVFILPDSLRKYRGFFVAMVYGQNGKIYLSMDEGNYRYIGVINKPHRRGKAADFKFDGIVLPEGMLYENTTPSTIDFRMGPVDGCPCDTLGLDNHVKALFRYDIVNQEKGKVDFRDLSEYHPTSWAWDFDDGNTSEERYPYHIYQEEGIYHVCLTASNMNGSDTYCRDVVIDNLTATQAIEILKMSVYPNPVVDGVITLKNPENIRGEYAISTIRGEVVKTGEITGMIQQQLQLPGVVGVYLLSIGCKNGVYSEKIVVKGK